VTSPSRLLAPALLLAALGPAPTAAQDAPPTPRAPESVAAALAAARAAGRLERALGSRAFRDEGGNLVEVEVRLVEEHEGEPLLRCRYAHTAVGAMRVETLELRPALGLDGRTRTAGFELVRGRDRSAATGTVDGERLTLTVTTARGDRPAETATREVEWPADTVPFTAALFLLPALAEDLPPRLRIRLFEPVTGAVAPEPSLVTTAAGEDGGWVVRLDHGPRGVDVVRVDAAGRPVEVVLRGATRLTPVEPAEAERLREGAVDPSGD